MSGALYLNVFEQPASRVFFSILSVSCFGIRSFDFYVLYGEVAPNKCF